MSWEISPTMSAAQLAASVARADAGAAASRLRFYTTARPATILDAHTDPVQAELVLAKPCGTVTDATLALHAADAAGAMVQFGGVPRWAEWIAGDGALLARADVTDLDHGGAIRVIGGKTPEGDNSPMFYAGGLILLGLVALT